MSNAGVSKNAPIVIAAQKISDARDKFESLARKTNAHLVFEREARFALEIVQNSDRLQACDPSTIYSSILNVAALGLSLNPVQGEAALIPRWNNKKRMLDCTLSPMYRGLVRLATESGRVSHIKAELVFADDEISMDFGTVPELHHNPIGSIMAGPEARVVDFIDPKRNRLKAVYVVAHLKDGGKIIGVASYDELLKVALCSEAFNPKPDRKTGQKKAPSGPWVEHPGEMAKKAVINREQKTWPRTSSEPDILDKAVEVIRDADEKEGYVSNQTDEPIAVAQISESQLKELTELAERQSLPLTRVCDVAGVESLEALPEERFGEIKQKLESRLQEYMKRKADEEEAPEKKAAPRKAATKTKRK
jgi:recombination protein RecT